MVNWISTKLLFFGFPFGWMDGWWAWVIGLERPKGTKDEVKRPFGPQLYDVLLPLDF